jgi:2-dehydropantoate 2-reductase
MRTLIFGAGAIGGYLGAIMSDAGRDVTLVARGAQYDALSTRGMQLDGPRSGRAQPIPVRVCKQGEERPPYDLVIVTLKAHQIAAVAGHLCTLVAPDGMLVFAQNGIPWWYFQKLDSPLRGTRLASLDPTGSLASMFPLDQIIGAIVNKPSDLVAPGHVRLADQETDCFTVGELDNRRTDRLERIAALITPTGWTVNISTDIRKAKWSKLLSNAIWNSIATLTQGTARDIAAFPPTAALAQAMIAEVIAVAASVGVHLDADPRRTVENATKRVPILSSTLQDVRAGRPIEIDYLVKAVIEIGTLTGEATPNLNVVCACAEFVNRRIIEDRVGIAPRAIG